MKNIIVPIDFSDDSLKGLDLAVLFSKKIPVTIQMVYVQKKSTDYPHKFDEEKIWAEQKFAKIIGDYQLKLGKGSSINYIIKHGKIYEEIVNQAHSYEDSFIATSTHGASGFEEMFIGSNANKIISSTDRPVFSIRKGNVPATISRIVLPIDIVLETRQKVPITASLAKLYNAEVHVISVSSTKDDSIINRLSDYVQQVVNYLKSNGIKAVSDTLYGDNITEITIDYARKVNADLISIVTEQSFKFSNLLQGSFAHQMVSKSEIPVLSFTPKHITKTEDSFITFGATGMEEQVP